MNLGSTEDENKLRIQLASNVMVGFCIERQKRIKSFLIINNSLPKVLLVHLSMKLIENDSLKSNVKVIGF